MKVSLVPVLAVIALSLPIVALMPHQNPTSEQPGQRGEDAADVVPPNPSAGPPSPPWLTHLRPIVWL
jgi:hypothetical protein